MLELLLEARKNSSFAAYEGCIAASYLEHSERGANLTVSARIPRSEKHFPDTNSDDIAEEVALACSILAIELEARDSNPTALNSTGNTATITIRELKEHTSLASAGSSSSAIGHSSFAFCRLGDNL